MRIRTIKPQFWRSPDVMALDHFQRLLFIGLWNLADDEGRGVYDPASIAADLFLTEFSLNPHGVITDVSRAFSEYSSRSMVAVYEVKKRQYFQILQWQEHQRVNRASKSQIPPMTSGNEETKLFSEDSLNTHGGLTLGIRNKEQGIRNKEKDMSEPSSDVPARKPNAYPDEFEQWWQAYPRHKNASKKKSLASWRKALKIIDSDKLLELTRTYAANPGVDEVRLIPHPTTWLNEHRWESVEATDQQPPSLPKRKSGWDFGRYDTAPPVIDAEVYPMGEIAR